MLIDLSYFAMALRQLCKETGRCPLKALFFFPEEKLTGIAPTRLIVEKGLVLREGLTVTVNWQGKKVRAEILALNGKLHYCLHYIFKTRATRATDSGFLVVALHRSLVDSLHFQNTCNTCNRLSPIFELNLLLTLKVLTQLLTA